MNHYNSFANPIQDLLFFSGILQITGTTNGALLLPGSLRICNSALAVWQLAVLLAHIQLRPLSFASHPFKWFALFFYDYSLNCFYRFVKTFFNFFQIIFFYRKKYVFNGLCFVMHSLSPRIFFNSSYSSAS